MNLLPKGPTRFYEREGYCYICEEKTVFFSNDANFRDQLQCNMCNAKFSGSVVRERALARCLNLFVPKYRELRIHDIAPVMRGISLKLKQQCEGYVFTNYFPNTLPGAVLNGIRNENIEAQTFPDNSFELVISLDVMEHVNRPDLAFREVARTLIFGGYYIFSVPTYRHLAESRRRAYYRDEGDVEHIEMPPEYHGNPFSKEGSLVTFHYGYDLVQNINKWSGLNVACLRCWDESIGVMGSHTEIYICHKSTL
jgi:SAM-dependent methyltransferase